MFQKLLEINILESQMIYRLCLNRGHRHCIKSINQQCQIVFIYSCYNLPVV